MAIKPIMEQRTRKDNGEIVVLPESKWNAVSFTYQRFEISMCAHDNHPVAIYFESNLCRIGHVMSIPATFPQVECAIEFINQGGFSGLNDTEMKQLYDDVCAGH